jgi:hypothetical protein
LVNILILRLCNYDKSPDHIESAGKFTLILVEVCIKLASLEVDLHVLKEKRLFIVGLRFFQSIQCNLARCGFHEITCIPISIAWLHLNVFVK